MIKAAILTNLIFAATAVAAFWRDAPYPVIELLVMMITWSTIRLYLTQGEEKAVKEEKDASRERLMACLVWVGMVPIPILTMALPVLDFASYKAAPAQTVAGVIIGTIAAYIFWCSHRDLGKNWSAHLEVRKEHSLVTNGIYRRVRHPMYTSLFLMCASQAIILNNWIAGPAGLVFFTLLYSTRIGAEEEMMRAQFGDEWDSYAAKTPRLLPGIRRG